MSLPEAARREEFIIARVTLRELNRATLARQMLLSRQAMKVPKAVAHLLGLQAQLPRPPFIGLWTRLEGLTRADVGRAIETQAQAASGQRLVVDQQGAQRSGTHAGQD